MRLTAVMRSVPAGEITESDLIVGIDSRAVPTTGLCYWIIPGRRGETDPAAEPVR